MFHSLRVIRLSGFVGAALLAVMVLSGNGSSAELTVIHKFRGGTDGEFPVTGVAIHGTQMYGTTFGTQSGGPGKGCSKNCGTLYRYDPSGGLAPLYSFLGKSDGKSPTGEPLYRDRFIYGTTQFGGGTACPGSTGCGTLFSLPAGGGTDNVLIRFCTTTYPDCPNGALPFAGPFIDSAGNIYGTTELGGSAAGNLCNSSFTGCGVVYMLTPQSSTPTVLYNFCSQANCTDGSEPAGKLFMDANGNLFGTTQFGGSNAAGTVFELLSGSHAYAPVYSFCSQSNCSDGEIPEAGLVADTGGNLYGTTVEGGDATCNCGVLFELKANGDGSYTYLPPLHTFTGGATDGARPEASLSFDDAGNIFGTTVKGGGGTYCDNPMVGCGTVFEWSADQSYTRIYSFGSLANRADGAQPEGTLRYSNGNLYGVARLGGGKCQCGTLFEIAVQGKTRKPAKQSLPLRNSTVAKPKQAHTELSF